VGALASRARLEHVQELVRDARAAGARQLCGGPISPPGLRGAFYAPAVLSGVAADMRIMREPISGPVLAVQGVDSVAQAISLANDCDYGLGASVWSADLPRAVRVARELRAGMVWINDHLPSPSVAQGPWGSTGRSGLGRTLGESGLRACAQEKLITSDVPRAPQLWRPPYDASLERAAHALALLRSARAVDRRRAWRRGGLALARVGARALAPRR
jgi:acyl-CoA reductase-like NAD-dependent aldehyde dehydrogenase